MVKKIKIGQTLLHTPSLVSLSPSHFFSLMPFILRVLLDPAEAGPQQKSLTFKMFWLWDLPGDPVVQTPLSNIGGGSSIPGSGTKTSHDSQSKNPKHMTEVRKSIKDFKNGPHKRILKK